ncbi:MAG: type IV pilus assembly protein PilM [Candidatus Aureabacteria bacterium]|nr:type IV pilus assembly protein PilM [Candidatus Auribacterota bacterium]
MNKKEISLGIDIGFRNIKFVELYKDGDSIYLKDFVVAPTNFTEDESEVERSRRVKQIIDTAIKEKKFNVQNIFLSVSNPLIFTRFIKVPITDPKKIAQMISFEAMQQIPFPLDEVVWDYQIMRTGIGEAEALLVAIKTDIIYGQMSDLGKSIPNAEQVDIGPLALSNMIYQNEAFSSFDNCHAVFGFGARSSYVVIMRKDIFWLRILPIGGDNVTFSIQKAFDIDFDTAEEYKLKGKITTEKEQSNDSEFNKRLNEQITSVYTKIIFEVKRSLNFFRTQYHGEKISSLSLEGGCSRIEGFEDFIKKNFPGMKIDQLDPFNQIIMSDLVDNAALVESLPFLGESVGLALRGLSQVKMNIDLMPKDILSKRMQKKNFKYYVAIVGFFFMFFLSKSFFDTRISGFYQNTIDAYTKELSGLLVLNRDYKNQKEKTRNIADDLNLMEDLFARKTFWLHLVSTLENLKNEHIWITAFENVDTLDEYTMYGDSEISQNIINAASNESEILSIMGSEKKRFLVISGETSAEYEAIDILEKGLKEIPYVMPESVKVLHARTPVDGIRAFAIGMELKK